MSFWLRVTGLLAANYDTIFCRRLYSDTSAFLIQRSGNDLVIGFQSTNYVTLTNEYYADNIWKHYVITARKSSTSCILTIYRNGTQINQSTLTWGYLNTGILIGVTADPGYQFLGNLDDIRIYDMVLTLQEVRELYNGRVSIYRKITNGGNGYVEQLTGSNLLLAVDGIDTISNSVPNILGKTSYGSGGDGNGGFGTQGTVIIRVPLNIQKPIFNGYIDYNNIEAVERSNTQKETFKIIFEF